VLHAGNPSFNPANLGGAVHRHSVDYKERLFRAVMPGDPIGIPESATVAASAINGISMTGDGKVDIPPLLTLRRRAKSG